MRERRLLFALLLSSGVSLGLLVVRMMSAGNTDFWYLAWNLFLAWVPLFFSWWLIRRLKTSRWRTPGNIVLTLLWLGFLPNAFYIASDIIHIRATGDISILYDVVLLVSFTFSGFILGFVSLYMVHRQLRQLLSKNRADALIGVVLLLCSFAIYLGRYLRWNSWDVLVNPAGLIFDVTEPFVNPSSHPQAFTTTLMFFVLLASIYAVCYQVVLSLQADNKKRR